MKGRTVIVSTFFDSKSGAPSPTDRETVAYLNKSGISRVVVGHKPFGDSPTIIQNAGLEVRTGLTCSVFCQLSLTALFCCVCSQVVSADQSYSDPRAKDNRGRAVSEVCVRLLRTTRPHAGVAAGAEGSYTEIHGCTHDGARFAFFLRPHFADSAAREALQPVLERR
jgi:hypothetical protein